MSNFSWAAVDVSKFTRGKGRQKQTDTFRPLISFSGIRTASHTNSQFSILKCTCDGSESPEHRRRPPHVGKELVQVLVTQSVPLLH